MLSHLSERSEQPPRHTRQVSEICIACVPHCGLCRASCRIEPANRRWTCTSVSGIILSLVVLFCHYLYIFENYVYYFCHYLYYFCHYLYHSVIIYIIFVIIYTILILGCGFFSHCVGEVLGIATCRACGHTNTGTEFGFHLCIRCLTMQYTSQGPSCGPAGVAASSASVRPCLRL